MREQFQPVPSERRSEGLKYTLAEKLTRTEARTRTLEIQQTLEASYLERESALKDKEIIGALREYGLDPSGVEREPNGLFRLPVKSHFSKRRLPKTEGDSFYAYKGGAARSLLLRSLRIDPTHEPRDVDIMAFGLEPKPGLDTQVAEQFMPDDFKHGDRVERLESFDRAIEDYFETRDLTLNEVLATDEVIWTTRLCLLDSIRRIIRVTPFERDSYHDEVGPKMLAKILRLYTEGIERWGNMTIAHDDWSFEGAFIQPFWLALQLDKACQQSLVLGEVYVKELVARRQIPKTIKTIEEAVTYLSAEVFNFAFRHAPVEQFSLEEKWAQMKIANTPKRIGLGRDAQKKVKRA